MTEKNTIIRTVSISKEDDEFLKKNKGSINFSNECRALIKQLRQKVEGTPEESV